MNRLNRMLSVEGLFTAFEKNSGEDFYFGGEMHDFWEFVYVADGKAGAAADDAIYHLERGQMIIHKPMEFHRLWAEEGTSPRFIIMSFQVFGSGTKQLENRIFQLDYGQEKMLNDLWNKIQDTFQNGPYGELHRRKGGDPMDLQRISNQMERLFLSLMEKPFLKDNRNRAQSAKNYSLLIRTIEEHLYEPLTLDRLGVLCSMSVSNIKKVFAQYAGQSVKQYIIRRKTAEAAELLSNGSSVTEVSEILSFSSQSYFSTVFKRVTGQKPSDCAKKEFNFGKIAE